MPLFYNYILYTDFTYIPQRILLQGYVFTGIYDSVKRGVWQTPPPGQIPPSRHPLGRTLPANTPHADTPCTTVP